MNIGKMREKPDFLYYGSSERLDILLPSQDYNIDGEKRTQKVIYATSIRDIALAYAIGAVPDENGIIDRVMSYKQDGGVKMIFHKGHPNFGGKGYVYRLSSKGFLPVGGIQWVNPSPVKPLEVTEINVDDYLFLFRYATEEEKQQLEEDFTEI